MWRATRACLSPSHREGVAFLGTALPRVYYPSTNSNAARLGSLYERNHLQSRQLDGSWQVVRPHELELGTCSEGAAMDQQAAKELVRPHFGFLLEDHRLTMVASVERMPTKTGWAIALESDGLSVRLLLDKGQVFVELGAGRAPRDYYDLGVILPFLTDGESSFEYHIPEGPISDEEIERQIARGTDTIRGHYARIAAFFLPDGLEERESELAAYRQERSDQYWKQTLR